ncbi:DUF6221 family protein [Streptomyces sp. NPDC051554]|uniref:DUF6221 family protein n=1 Tax=Streptomyces sp. NPDC051554 TaxID=3365656 RepID=UPI0037A2B447
MTGTDRMVAWLRETLAAAQADAEGATPGPWHVTDYPYGYDLDAVIGTSPLDCDVVSGSHDNGGGVRLADARHIARHDPSAVLRRILADRELLDLHHEVAGKCWECNQGYELMDWGPDFPCTSVRLLAKGYGWTDSSSVTNQPTPTP